MCLSRSSDSRWAACLVIRSRREICFVSHKQMWDTASSATVALNMINVSEHYIQCLKWFWLCFESARDHQDLWVFCKLMSVRQLHLSILLSVKHFCRLFVNKFSSAFTNKQKCNSTGSSGTIFFSKFWNHFSEIYRKEQKFNSKGFSGAWQKPKSSKIVFEQGYPIPAEKKPKLPFRTVLRRHDPILVHARKAARALRWWWRWGWWGWY